LSVNTFEQHS